MTAFAEDTAAALAEAGTTAAFGVPGSGDSLALLMAMDARGIGFVGTAHEAAGAIMAGAFARQSGSLGCAVSIKGPGLANMLPGLLVAHDEGWPVVAVAEAYSPSANPHRMHKRLDQAAATQAFVKAHATLGDPAAVVRRLSQRARAERPGPVHLDLFPPAAAGAWREEAVPPAPPAAPDALRRAIEAARRPVVIAGSLATRRPWGHRLAALRVPIFTTVAAKGVLDEHTACAAGVFTGDGGPLAPETPILAEADLVVGLGLRALEILGVRPFRAPFVAVDAVPTAGMEGLGPSASIWDADDDTFTDVLDALARADWGREALADARTALRRHLVTDAWLPGAVLAAAAAAKPHLRLVTDTGLFCTAAEHVWQARDWRDFLGSANGRHMGTALPMALGAAMADPARPILCVIGDGGWGHAVELRLAVARRLPLLLLFLTDGRYGSLAAAPSAAGARPEMLRLPAASWVAAVEGLGCPSRRVERIDDVDSAVRSWNPAAGPLFLEAAFDPERYAAMTEGVR